MSKRAEEYLHQFDQDGIPVTSWTWEDMVKCYDDSRKQAEKDLVPLIEAATIVYEAWNGGTMDDVRREMAELGKVLNARKEESVSVAKSPSKTFPRVNEFDCGSSYRH